MSSNSNTDQYCKSVKALIYNSAGEILIQQRDYKHGLRWPGAWNLFGGMIENDETFLEGVERELIEELGILPGKIEDVIFEWVSEDGVLDKCFSVFQSNKNLNITLKEGNSMKWVHPTDLINLEKYDWFSFFSNLIRDQVILNWKQPSSAQKGMAVEILITLVPTGEIIQVNFDAVCMTRGLTPFYS
mgnify:CR=1 FL=1